MEGRRRKVEGEEAEKRRRKVDGEEEEGGAAVYLTDR